MISTLVTLCSTVSTRELHLIQEYHAIIFRGLVLPNAGGIRALQNRLQELAEDVDITAVARHFNLTILKDRATCPVCESERSIQLFAETNSFRCHSAGLSGDCISLCAHLTGTGMYPAAKALSKLFATPSGARNNSSTTAPQKPEARTAPHAQPAPSFDPESYLTKLQ